MAEIFQQLGRLPEVSLVSINAGLELKCPVIVIDNGSGFTKAGFAGDSALNVPAPRLPSAVFPSIVGRCRLRHYDSCWGSAGIGARTKFAGEEAQQKRGILFIKHPVEHGIVTSWNYMEELWHHTLYGVLKVPPEEHPVLLTEVPFNSKENREKMAEIMFESFMVHSLNIATQPELALIASSRKSGVVVESGDGVTHIVPIYDGYPIQDAILRLDFGGRDLTTYFMNLVSLTNYYSLMNAERDRGRQAKENLYYVALDYQTEMGKRLRTLRHLMQRTLLLKKRHRLLWARRGSWSLKPCLTPDCWGWAMTEFSTQCTIQS